MNEWTQWLSLYSFCFWLEFHVLVCEPYENRNDCVIPCSVLRFTITWWSNGRNSDYLVIECRNNAWRDNQMGPRRQLPHLSSSIEILFQIFNTPNHVCPDSLLYYHLLVLSFHDPFVFYLYIWKRWVLTVFQNINSDIRRNSKYGASFIVSYRSQIKVFTIQCQLPLAIWRLYVVSITHISNS